MGVGVRSCWVIRPRGTLVHSLKNGSKDVWGEKEQRILMHPPGTLGMWTMTTWEDHWPDQVFASCALWWPVGVDVL